MCASTYGRTDASPPRLSVMPRQPRSRRFGDRRDALVRSRVATAHLVGDRRRARPLATAVRLCCWRRRGQRYGAPVGRLDGRRVVGRGERGADARGTRGSWLAIVRTKTTP